MNLFETEEMLIDERKIALSVVRARYHLAAVRFVCFVNHSPASFHRHTNQVDRTTLCLFTDKI